MSTGILAHQYVLYHLTGVCGTRSTTSVARIPDPPTPIHSRTCSLRATPKEERDQLSKGPANVCLLSVIINAAKSTVILKEDKVVNLQFHQVFCGGSWQQHAPCCGAAGVGESRVAQRAHMSLHTVISTGTTTRIRWTMSAQMCPELVLRYYKSLLPMSQFHVAILLAESE